MKLAAIDIGSNAARLLINEVQYNNEKVSFEKLNLFRIPLRLGFDVFETGTISEIKKKMLLNTMKAFQTLMDVYEVTNFRACATSAMRDATNAQEILKTIKKETGINIEVISGDEEAMLVYENHIADFMNNNAAYMYIDVGGGSTECTLFYNNNLIFKESFNIGTIRLLKNLVGSSNWAYMKERLEQATKGLKKVVAIGSGGNINKIFSLSKNKDGKPLEYGVLKNFYKTFSSITMEQRMEKYYLKPDRADVIVPALEIYINIMKWTEAAEIYVPKIGVADGIMHKLYEKIISTQ